MFGIIFGAFVGVVSFIGAVVLPILGIIPGM